MKLKLAILMSLVFATAQLAAKPSESEKLKIGSSDTHDAKAKIQNFLAQATDKLRASVSPPSIDQLQKWAIAPQKNMRQEEISMFLLYVFNDLDFKSRPMIAKSLYQLFQADSPGNKAAAQRTLFENLAKAEVVKKQAAVKPGTFALLAIKLRLIPGCLDQEGKVITDSKTGAPREPKLVGDAYSCEGPESFYNLENPIFTTLAELLTPTSEEKPVQIADQKPEKAEADAQSNDSVAAPVPEGSPSDLNSFAQAGEGNNVPTPQDFNSQDPNPGEPVPQEEGEEDRESASSRRGGPGGGGGGGGQPQPDPNQNDLQTAAQLASMLGQAGAGMGGGGKALPPPPQLPQFPQLPQAPQVTFAQPPPEAAISEGTAQAMQYQGPTEEERAAKQAADNEFFKEMGERNTALIQGIIQSAPMYLQNLAGPRQAMAGTGLTATPGGAAPASLSGFARNVSMAAAAGNTNGARSTLSNTSIRGGMAQAANLPVTDRLSGLRQPTSTRAITTRQPQPGGREIAAVLQTEAPVRGRYLDVKNLSPRALIRR